MKAVCSGIHRAHNHDSANSIITLHLDINDECNVNEEKINDCSNNNYKNDIDNNNVINASNITSSTAGIVDTETETTAVKIVTDNDVAEGGKTTSDGKMTSATIVAGNEILFDEMTSATIVAGNKILFDEMTSATTVAGNEVLFDDKSMQIV